ncbi:hypothetical protein [Rhizobium sp. Root1203]|nr:hypothetical protein [Rhizobium sp. Root1203]
MWQEIWEALTEALRLATFQSRTSASRTTKEGNPGRGRQTRQAEHD